MNKSDNQNRLEMLRNQIDKIDAEILEIFCKRFDVVEEIGICKKEYNVRILQMTRWINMLNKRIKSGIDLNLSEQLVDELFQLIHEESMNVQSKIMNT